MNTSAFVLVSTVTLVKITEPMVRVSNFSSLVGVVVVVGAAPYRLAERKSTGNTRTRSVFPSRKVEFKNDNFTVSTSVTPVRN